MGRFKKLMLLAPMLGMILAGAPACQVAAQAEAAEPMHSSNGDSVQAWLTDVPSNTWIARQHDLAFKPKQAGQPLTISVDQSRKYQRVLGFGAALTDSSAWLIGNQMSEDQRTELMKKLFDPSDGIGLSLIRVPMGASDFSASGDYSYDDMPKGASDPTLSNFTIRHDAAYIIPQLKQALSLNPSVRIMANPWSPPGWMKTTDSMEGGTLKNEYFSALAGYFLKFIQQYQEAGVPVSFISPQNEPQYTGGYPGLKLSAEQESRLIRDIGELFESNHVSTQILAWDHNWDMPAYPEQIYSDPTVSRYSPATAWHCYGGNVTAQSGVHNDYPGKGALITECSGGTWQGGDQKAFQAELNTLIIEGMRNWAQGVMLWNLALDQNHGPTNNGCLTCNGLVTIDRDSGRVAYNADYYALGQASKFVQTGAYRIYSNTFGAGSVEDVAFMNPDGSKVLIAFNSGNSAKTFSVADGTRSFDYTLNAGDAVTLKWAGPPQNGNHATAAASVQDSTHDFTFRTLNGFASDPIIVTYDPALPANGNSIRSGNSLITYSLPYGASVQTAETETGLDRSHWSVTASSNGNAAANAIDNDLSTRWTSGHGQTNGDWFQIDLGTRLVFNQIVLDTGAGSAGDYIRRYQVYTSDDGVNWNSAIVDGSGNGPKVAISLPAQTAQYIRIVGTGSSGSWWSIGEIQVYAPSKGTDSGSITGPTGESSGLQVQSWTSPEGALVTVVYNGSDSSQFFPISADSSVTYTLPGGAAAMFTISQSSGLQQPAIGGLTPDMGMPGQTVTIQGSNFGNAQGLGTVNFGSAPGSILRWSDSSIDVMVPSGPQSGTVTVSVYSNNGLFAGTAPFTVRTPPALPRTGWVATASNVSPYGDVPGNMLDGNLNTRYSSGTGQHNGLWVTVDMGQAQTFDQIAMDAGSSPGDYARSADIFVSSDGASWSKVASVIGDGPLEVAAFPVQTARYIKVVNTGSSGSWWSIAEFNVYKS